jgi:hypothetical protein
LEHLTLAASDEGVVATSVVIGERNGTNYGVAYKLVCDASWRVRSVDLKRTDGRKLVLESDGDGHWRDGEGERLSRFDGCVDVDLSGSPFTNTIPIRRLEPGGDGVVIDSLYIPFDDFDPIRDAQRYVGIEPARRYRYESVDGSFAAEIEVDDEGLVLAYPPLFARADNIGAGE